MLSAPAKAHLLVLGRIEGLRQAVAQLSTRTTEARSPAALCLSPALPSR